MDITVPLTSEEPVVVATTVRADKPVRVELTLEPYEAQAVIKQVGYRKIDHADKLPRLALLLDMRHHTSVQAGPLPGSLASPVTTETTYSIGAIRPSFQAESKMASSIRVRMPLIVRS
jgi:hypothetical protein